MPVQTFFEPDPTSNLIIRVDRGDRSGKLSYPDWMKEVVHPELECAGPAEYDLSTLELWLHHQQKKEDGCVKGQVIYDHLRNTNTLARCLNLQDGLAIRAKGIPGVFRDLFGVQPVILWGSVLRDHNDQLGAPYLESNFDHPDWIKLGWLSLEVYFSDYPTLRFGK